MAIPEERMPDVSEHVATQAVISAVGRLHGLASVVPSKRPIPVCLLDFGGGKKLDLGRLSRTLNRLQTLFQYSAPGPRIDWFGKHDVLHMWTAEHLYGYVLDHIRGTGYEYGIAITQQRLEGNQFNCHDEARGVGLVTTDDYRKYLPSGKSLAKYVAYLVLCESFCIVGRRQFEHDESVGCLFDICDTKTDIIQCLEEPKIFDHNGCRIALKDAGFTDQDIDQAERILHWVDKRSLFEAFQQSAANPIAGFFFGGLVVHILGATLATFQPPWLYAVAGVLAIPLLVSVCGYYLGRAIPLLASDPR